MMEFTHQIYDGDPSVLPCAVIHSQLFPSGTVILSASTLPQLIPPMLPELGPRIAWQSLIPASSIAPLATPQLKMMMAISFLCSPPTILAGAKQTPL